MTKMTKSLNAKNDKKWLKMTQNDTKMIENATGEQNVHKRSEKKSKGL